MLAAQLHAREVRSRLWHPTNGRESSEIEVVSKAELALQSRRAALAAAVVEAAQRRQRRDELVAAFIEAHKRTAFQYQPRETERGERALTFEQIARAVCRFYGEKRIHVFSQRRSVELVRPRQIIMHLCREHTDLSLPVIGRLLGGRDHTTVLHGSNKIKALVESDGKLAADIAEIKRMTGLEGE